MSNKRTDTFYIYGGGPQAWPKLQARLRKWQYETEDTQDLSDSAKLKKAGVVIIDNAWGKFTKQEIDAVDHFVTDGGGLLVAGLGWSWRMYGPNGPGPGGAGNNPPQLMEAYPMNQLLERFGATWTRINLNTGN